MSGGAAIRPQSGAAGASVASVTLAARSCALHICDWSVAPAPRLSQTASVYKGKEDVDALYLAAFKKKVRFRGLSA